MAAPNLPPPPRPSPPAPAAGPQRHRTTGGIVHGRMPGGYAPAGGKKRDFAEYK